MTITYSFYVPTKHLADVQQIVKKYDLRFANNPAKYVNEINKKFGPYSKMLLVEITGIDSTDISEAMNEIDTIIDVNDVIDPKEVPKKSFFSSCCKFFIDIIK